MPNTDKTILLPQLQRYDQKIKGWADNKFLTKADTPSLPKATATTLGGVKVGYGLSVTNDGMLNAEDDIVFTWDFDTSAFSCNKTFAEVKKITTTGVRRTATVNGLLENFSITLLVQAANDNVVIFLGTAPSDTLGSGVLGSKTNGTITYLFQRGLVIAYASNGQIQMIEDLSNLNTNMSFDFKNTTFQYDQYNSFDLKDGGITPAKLADGAVTSAKIANSAITAAKLASDAVTENKISNGAITRKKIADSAVSSINIAPLAITRTKIADDAIESNHIADGQITVSHIKDGSVTSAKLALGAVNAENINEGAIVEAKISDGAVKTAKLADGAVTAEKIANSAITAAKLSSNSVTTKAILTGAVTSTKLAADAVTAGKIKDGAVTADKIADGAITKAKLASDVGASDMKYAQVTRFSSSNWLRTSEPIIGNNVFYFDDFPDISENSNGVIAYNLIDYQDFIGVVFKYMFIDKKSSSISFRFVDTKGDATSYDSWKDSGLIAPFPNVTSTMPSYTVSAWSGTNAMQASNKQPIYWVPKSTSAQAALASLLPVQDEYEQMKAKVAKVEQDWIDNPDDMVAVDGNGVPITIATKKTELEKKQAELEKLREDYISKLGDWKNEVQE